MTARRRVNVTTAGVAPLAVLGENMSTVRDRLGATPAYGESSAAESVDAFGCGVRVAYDSRGLAVEVEVGPPLIATFQGVELSGRPLTDVRADLREVGVRLQDLAGGSVVVLGTNISLLVAIERPGGFVVSGVRVRGVGTPDPGYCDRTSMVLLGNALLAPDRPEAADALPGEWAVALAVEALLGRQPRNAWAVRLFVGGGVGVAFLFQMSRVMPEDMADIDAVLKRFVDLSDGWVGVQRCVEVAAGAAVEPVPSVSLFSMPGSRCLDASTAAGEVSGGGSCHVRRVWEQYFAPRASTGLDDLPAARSGAQRWWAHVVVTVAGSLDGLVPPTVSAVGVEVDGWRVVVHLVGTVQREAAADSDGVDDVEEFIDDIEHRLDQRVQLSWDVLPDASDAPEATTWVHRRRDAGMGRTDGGV